MGLLPSLGPLDLYGEPVCGPLFLCLYLSFGVLVWNAGQTVFFSLFGRFFADIGPDPADCMDAPWGTKGADTVILSVDCT